MREENSEETSKDKEEKSSEKPTREKKIGR